MTETELSPVELRQKAIEVLFRELGAKNACRFLGLPFNEGRGNYTEDRQKLLEGMTMESIKEGILAMRKAKLSPAKS